MITYVFTRKELSAAGQTCSQDYVVNARALVAGVGYRCCCFDGYKPTRVRFRRRMDDPGYGLLTTFQETGPVVVISAWDGHTIRILIDVDGCQRQVYNDWGEDHILLLSYYKENPWLQSWLMAGPGATDHYLPESVAAEADDPDFFRIDIGYDKFRMVYPGVSRFISVYDWRQIPRDAKDLSTTYLGDRKLKDIPLHINGPYRIIAVRHGVCQEFDENQDWDKLLVISPSQIKVFGKAGRLR